MKVPEVPTTAADRTAIMNMCTFLNEMNGAYQDYPKIDFSPLEQLKREFQCQDLLDDLSSNEIQIYAGTHYRFEPIVSEEPNILLIIVATQ